ncbi:olfactory receptor 52E4-like [Pleurodeles waltl]|uniref:olfactory receptor 52E4-like n=1 Tax=Pleurodeles waltl TaxID=8319 RepID=UPI0037097D22
MLANDTGFTPSFFILIGIPSLEKYHMTFAAPLTVIYVITILGNCTLLLAVKSTMSLQKPMYLIIALLSCSDMVLSSSILPKMMGSFWFNHREISFSICFFQLFFVHAFAGVESAILTTMAIDRYVAVCNPLRYSTIITNSLVAKAGIASVSRSIIIVVPLTIFAARLPFCSTYIPHSFCEHIAVVKLSCVDITFNSTYGAAITLFVGAIDIPTIALSYILILRAILRLPRKDRFKAFSTCVAHVCVMSLFYIPITFSLSLHRSSTSIPLYVHILVVNAYLLLPPVANPLIYGLKTAEIRIGVLQMIHKGKARMLCNY